MIQVPYSFFRFLEYIPPHLLHGMGKDFAVLHSISDHGSLISLASTRER